KPEPILTRFGGPLSWSQGSNVATIGATLASIEIHRSPELGQLQKKLQENIALFDSLVETPQRYNGLNIKLVTASSETQAAHYSGEIYKRGFYTSAVFFPLLERGKAGLRVMLRADNQPEDIRRFSQVVRDVVQLD
ncbi:MAG TPA: 7-keto-8-aminopelargonate synthetase, partial [Thermoanaerobaculia bacterium]